MEGNSEILHRVQEVVGTAIGASSPFVGHMLFAFVPAIQAEAAGEMALIGGAVGWLTTKFLNIASNKIKDFLNKRKNKNK